MKLILTLSIALAGSTAFAQAGAPATAPLPNGGAMPIGAWLGVLALGAAAGAVGQLVRAISGLAKLARDGTTTFDASNLVVSLLVGATAGALAALLLLAGNPVPDTPTILGLMAAGYAGADFIEGFAGKYLKPGSSPLPTDPVKLKEEIRQIAIEGARAALASGAAGVVPAQNAALLAAPVRDEPAVG